MVVCHCFPYHFTWLCLNRLRYLFVTSWVNLGAHWHCKHFIPREEWMLCVGLVDKLESNWAIVLEIKAKHESMAVDVSNSKASIAIFLYLRIKVYLILYYLILSIWNVVKGIPAYISCISGKPFLNYTYHIVNLPVLCFSFNYHLWKKLN